MAKWQGEAGTLEGRVERISIAVEGVLNPQF